SAVDITDEIIKAAEMTQAYYKILMSYLIVVM
ncbi:MAG: hypothetical protein JWR68_1674, partial [Polaromonas sp.]|nr:hypothetical protein [Polaromonas sp.]